MLGRLQAAYECFKFVALTFDDVRNLELEPASPSRHIQINTNPFLKLLQKLSVNLELPKGILKSKAAKKYKNASSSHVHAEMQILVSLGKDPERRKRAHPYIGVSKTLCVLCDQILRNYSPLAEGGARRPSFKARGCHGKVYPLWTLPHCEDQPTISQLSLATAVSYTHSHIREQLQQQLQLKPGRAESSAGVTSVSSLPTDLALLQRRHVVDQAPQDPPKIAYEDSRSSRLGRMIEVVQVGLFPANGEEPSLVSIAFHALPPQGNHKLVEYGHEHVPDFHDSWNVHQFDRRYRDIPTGDGVRNGWEGNYRIYWNENDALPDNETVKAFLGIEEVDPWRRFWYGDVFLVRCSEHTKTYKFDVHDLQLASLRDFRLSLKKEFQDMWKVRFLEAELKQDQRDEERRAKSETDKYILLQRMTPVEKDVLSRMPPGTLDFLAVRDCDDGATRGHRIEQDPNNPDMMKITYMRKVSALDSLGWTGFSSDQL